MSSPQSEPQPQTRGSTWQFMRSQTHVRTLALGALLLTTPIGSAVDHNWPQWRGPQRDSKLAEPVAWPKDLSNLTRAWRVELEPSYSGPIVWKDRVFVTETRDKKEETVRALDRATGKEIWVAKWDGAMSVPFFAKKNGDWIRATPACDGESLFVAGMRDALVCLDIESGHQRWRVDFPQKLSTPIPSFGFVSSPLVVGDDLYVQAGGAFVKLNKKSGEVLWRTLEDGGGMDSAFSSPILTTLHGVPQLVVQTRQKIAGVNPATGAVLWSQIVPSFRGMNILTPSVFDGGVFTSSYQNKSFFYQIDRTESEFKISEAWTCASQGYMSSPVIIGQHAYLHLANKRVCCIDLKTGKEMWRSEAFGEYWSMVANGDRILALDQRGDLYLVAADPQQFRILDRKEVATAESWAHLAASGDLLFVRDLDGISAFNWK